MSERPSTEPPSTLRATVLLFLALFAAGRVLSRLDMPRPPVGPSAVAPPAEGEKLLDARRTPSGRLAVFPSGTTVGEALEVLALRPAGPGWGFVLPRAGVVVGGEGGWSVRPMTQAQRWLCGLPMEVNGCRREDFLRLPGIGPALAERLERHLLDTGGVGSLTEFLTVEGVGEARLKAMAPFLILGEGGTMGTAPKGSEGTTCGEKAKGY